MYTSSHLEETPRDIEQYVEVEILKVGRVYELINCSTTFTTFSELSLLRGERQELERIGRDPEKKDKEMTEKSFEEILLTGDLHSEGLGNLPSAFQPSVLTRVKMMIIIIPPPLALKSGVWSR